MKPSQIKKKNLIIFTKLFQNVLRIFSKFPNFLGRHATNSDF